MPMLVEVYVGVGARSLVALEAAAGGAYSIVSISLLGSGFVWNSGMTTTASRRTNWNATDPIAAQGFRGCNFPPDSIRLS